MQKRTWQREDYLNVTQEKGVLDILNSKWQ